MLLFRLVAVFGLTFTVLARPGRQQPLIPAPVKNGSPRPLVVWHGLGDTADSEGMATLKRDIERMYPGIFVLSVKVPGEGSLGDERKAGFVSSPLEATIVSTARVNRLTFLFRNVQWGNATDQVDLVAEKIIATPELAQGFGKHSLQAPQSC